MKRLLLSSALLGLVLTAPAQNGVLYQREMLLPSGFTYNGAEDYIVDQTNAKAVGLVNVLGTPSGTMLFKSDLNNGTITSANIYFGPAANPWSNARVLAIGGNYYTLGTYTSNTATLALSKIDGVTGNVIFSKYIRSSITGLSPSLTVTDLAYDGSTYLYALGSVYNTTQGQTDMWVGKLDLNGNLAWIKTLTNSTWDEFPQNIFCYSATEIYIGATTQPVGASLQMIGLMVQIDNNCTVINSKDAQYWAPGAGPRMIAFNVKRLGSYLYVVGQTMAGRDGAGPLVIGKYDLSMNNVVHTEYMGSDGSFMFNPEFYFTNNKILVPGNKNLYNAFTPGYVHAFFDLNTSFLNANDNTLNDNLFGTVIAYPAASGHIFSMAENAVNNTSWYRIKGQPNTQATTCDLNYTFFSWVDTLILQLHPVPPTNMRSLTMTDFTAEKNTINLSDNIICYYDPYAQRTGHINDGSSSTDLSAYPNPLAGALHIQLTDAALGGKLEVLDLSGRIVYSEAAISSTALQIDASGWNNGVYFVRVSMNDGSLITRKVVKE